MADGGAIAARSSRSRRPATTRARRSSRADGRILSNVISSQDRFHERYGGVVPEVASRHHLELVNAVVDDALQEAGIELRDAGSGGGHQPARA